MFFPDYRNTFTFSCINQTGKDLTGNYQKVFFTNVGHLNSKVVKNITIFDQDLHAGNILFDGTNFTLFDKVKDTPKTYLYLLDNKNNIVLDRFPLNLLKKANISDISKQYNFELKNIDWLRSYAIKSDLLNVWDRNKGFLISIYF
jgi:hypothetical protein